MVLQAPHPQPGARQTRHLRLVQAVKEEFTSSGGTYGSPEIWIALVRKGWRISVNTIAKIMAELGLAGRGIRRRRGLTRPGERPAAPDFVRRDFTAEAPDLVWYGDMTEIKTGEGKLYLATVIDLLSRSLLGYATGAKHDADLVVAALHMAGPTRGGTSAVSSSLLITAANTRLANSAGPAADWASPSPWPGSVRALTAPSVRRSTAR
ncbi:IS3 family transposase [Streptomyces sp. NPDC058470]|uniref:IS3 family transposase n=1 Tax=Streptomyces sp. NPDC058470 TaxID=3346515 RepID=UPI003656157E